MERRPAGVGERWSAFQRVLGGKDGSETQLQLHPNAHSPNGGPPKCICPLLGPGASNLIRKVTPGASLRVLYRTHGERHRGLQRGLGK